MENKTDKIVIEKELNQIEIDLAGFIKKNSKLKIYEEEIKEELNKYYFQIEYFLDRETKTIDKSFEKMMNYFRDSNKEVVKFQKFIADCKKAKTLLSFEKNVFPKLDSITFKSRRNKVTIEKSMFLDNLSNLFMTSQPLQLSLKRDFSHLKLSSKVSSSKTEALNLLIKNLYKIIAKDKPKSKGISNKDCKTINDLIEIVYINISDKAVRQKIEKSIFI